VMRIVGLVSRPFSTHGHGRGFELVLSSVTLFCSVSACS
jgi:hypothetical protein